ncbi:hypothetical protein [Opitutus sp. ER46]|uniref:hypothetical protein n=1 Tax=Opitutus sp. ER46 TaxID=2161864 RepID=UPI000D300CCD|nr:hypothetical protein [Opitutus sp. ER46]PTX98529.1 hypothetical protein DB354_04500 [Opitutus sp. ER46]
MTATPAAPASGRWKRTLLCATVILAGLGVGFVARWANADLSRELTPPSGAALPTNAWVEVRRGGAVAFPSRDRHVIIAESDFDAELNGAKRALRRGDVVLITPGQRWQAPARAAYLDVRIPSSHPPGRAAPHPIAPVKNVLRSTAPDFFVYEEQLLPGDSRPAHTHATRLVVVINATELRATSGQVYAQVPGTVKFITEPAIHEALTNIGPLPLRNIVIEFPPATSLSPTTP